MYLFILLILSQVKINEVFYNPSLPQGPHERFGEWIELYNSGSETVDLSGWIISDENDWDSVTLDEGYFYIPNGTQLAPSEFLLLVHNIDTFEATFGELQGVTVIQYGPNPMFILNNSGDDLHLFRPDGTEEDMVYWGGGGDLEPINPAPQVENGHSIGRYPDGSDSDNPEFDFHDYDEPSPGGENPAPASIVESEVVVKKEASAESDHTIYDLRGRRLDGVCELKGRWGIFLLMDERGRVHKVLVTPQGILRLKSLNQ